MYYIDNSIQLDYLLEDPEYTKWLDPDPEVGAYRKYNLGYYERTITTRTC